jgi:hypothetical protein
VTYSRSKIQLAALSLAALLAGSTFTLQAQHPTPSPPKPIPSPNDPNPNYPPGLQGPDAKGSDPKQVDKQNQLELQNDIDKLYALAFELREQMKLVDTKSTMSVTVVRRAQAIEKLAKEIKDRAKR